MKLVFTFFMTLLLLMALGGCQSTQPPGIAWETEPEPAFWQVKANLASKEGDVVPFQVLELAAKHADKNSNVAGSKLILAHYLVTMRNAGDLNDSVPLEQLLVSLLAYPGGPEDELAIGVACSALPANYPLC